jgi:pimeloyl-ACP methyl ester carboxylesterase
MLVAAATIAVAACTPGSEPEHPPTSTTATDPTVTSTTEDISEERPSTRDILDDLGGMPCPDSDFTCVTIEVPLDHDQPDDGATIPVTFAVLPASGETTGAFVTANGGPGVAGVAYADSYTSVLDPAITASYDIVFFDQRGTTLSGALSCPEAAVAWYHSDADTDTPAAEEALAAAAETFAADCVAEMGDAEMLGFLSTAQAIEDLEAFRAALRYENLVLYGESYGTQFAQTYAAAHPDRVQRMILDGTVDLTNTGFEYFAEQAAAAGRTLEWTLAACDDEPACAFDVATTASAAYDRLAALLAEEPIMVDFPLPQGGWEERSFEAADLEVVAAGQMYGEEDRMLFLRALAAFSGRSDLVPMLRLLYPNLGLDPADETVVPDPFYSDAVYYGVECLDYSYRSSTAQAAADAFFRAGDDLDGAPLGSLFYGDLPCVYWPHAPQNAARPQPLAAEGIPTLVLGAEADPATPYEQSASVSARLADGHLIRQTGGPHVIFGRGNPCPDDAVTAFVLDGTAPKPNTVCRGSVIGDYQPLLPVAVSDLGSAEEALLAIEAEIYYLPEYYYWDGADDTAAGCHLGGTVTATVGDTGYSFSFDGCGLAPGLLLDGTGSYDWDRDVFVLELSVSSAECEYTYRREEDRISVDDRCAADPFR